MARRRRKAKKETTDQVTMKRKQADNAKKQLQPQGPDQARTQEEATQGQTSKTQGQEQSTASQAAESQSQETAVLNPAPEDKSVEGHLSESASVDRTDLIGGDSTKKGNDEEPKTAEEEMIEMADSESTTSASTIEFLIDDMEKEESVFSRGRQLSTPTRGIRSVDPSPTSTTSSRNSTPQRSGSRRESLSPTPSGTGSVVNSAFPVRPGIVWKAGSRVEAMDFIEKWYPARIVEINAPELEALIHFEGWNSRYDEWVPMTSERLRPLARHSERREGKRGAPKTDYKIGECVFAKWTDCRHYAARIISINPSGSYDVVFFDGFKKTVQPINVKYMPPEVQVEYGNAGLLPPHPKQLKRRSRDALKDGTGISKEMQRSSEKPPCPYPRQEQSPKVPESGETETKPGSSKRKRSIGGGSTGKRPKMEPGTAEQTREEVFTGHVTSTPKEKKPSVSSPSFSVPASRRESYLMAMLQNALPSYHTSPITSGQQVKKLTPSPAEGLQPGVGAEGAGIADVASPHTPLDTLHIRAPKAFKVEEDHNQYKCPFEGCPKAFRKESLVEYHIKYYHTHDGKPIPPPPPRKRKKTNSVFDFDWKQLLCLKSKKGQKRRHKRSTDSEISVGGRSSSSKRKRRLTEVSLGSLPDTTLDRLQLHIEDSMGSDMLEDQLLGGAIEIDHHEAQVTDDSIALGEEAGPIKKDEEVVNCICQLNDENGLMIQCEVCLCWQHANCMELTDETLPKRYVCYVCTNPPGIRDSARFIYVQDWFREGRLSSFNFLPVPENAEESSARMLGLHDLTGETHNVNRVLDSLRRKIHILQEKNHPEFHFWKKNWDREIEKKRQEAEASENPSILYNPHIKLEPGEAGEGASQQTDNQLILSSSELETTVASMDSPAVMEGTLEVTLESGPSVELQEEVCGDEVCAEEVCGEEVCAEEVCAEECEVDMTEELVQEQSDALQSASSNKEHVGCDAGAPLNSGLHDYSVNARSAPGSPLQVDGDQEELDSDVAVTPTEEDPIATCEKNLLEHIMNMQDRLAERLELIDQHVTAMEELDNMRVPHKDVLADVPVLKKKLHHVINDLVKVKRMSRFH